MVPTFLGWTSDEWQAVGTVAAAVFALAAFVHSVRSGRSNKRVADAAKTQAERSAEAAETSAAAARDMADETRRANQIAEARAVKDLEDEKRLIGIDANLVSGQFTHGSGRTAPGNRISVDVARVNISHGGFIYPALQVEYRHVEHIPDFRFLTDAIRPGTEFPTVEIRYAEPFETAEDNSELTDGFEMRFNMAGYAWEKKGRSAAKVVD